jgi:hypothetical protein
VLTVSVLVVIVLAGLIGHALVVALAASSTAASASSTVSASSACAFQSTAVVNNTACPPRNDRGCQSGTLIPVDDGVELCDYFDHAPGTACTSACHVEDTATTCDDDHACSNADPTTCLGYCVTSGEHGSGSPDCDDKLTFIDYFTWNTSLSSNDFWTWLHYSDYAPECHQIEGCRWYAAGLYVKASATSYYTPQTSYYPSCVDFLNMTNAECIRAYSFNFTESLSNAVFSTALSSTASYQAFGCIYNYACGVRNETFMTDPDLLLKRATDNDASASTRFAQLTEAHAGAMRAKWAAPLEEFKRRQERLESLVAAAVAV